VEYIVVVVPEWPVHTCINDAQVHNGHKRHRCDMHASCPVLNVLCRAAGKSVAETLTAGTPSAVVKCLDLDTADINSIKQLANVVKQEYDQQIDLLVSMWGCAAVPNLCQHNITHMSLHVDEQVPHWSVLFIWSHPSGSTQLGKNSTLACAEKLHFMWRHR
jgi:hypothetical protein